MKMNSILFCDCRRKFDLMKNPIIKWMFIGCLQLNFGIKDIRIRVSLEKQKHLIFRCIFKKIVSTTD